MNRIILKKKKVINFLIHALSRYNINKKCFYINFEVNDFEIIIINI